MAATDFGFPLHAFKDKYLHEFENSLLAAETDFEGPVLEFKDESLGTNYDQLRTTTNYN